MFPDQLESMAAVLSVSKIIVEGLYDCNPDHKDELEFREGELIVVTKRLNKDWWVSQSPRVSCSLLCQ